MWVYVGVIGCVGMLVCVCVCVCVCVRMGVSVCKWCVSEGIYGCKCVCVREGLCVRRCYEVN